MDDIISSPMSSNVKKRAAPHDESPGKKPLNLKGSQFMMPTPPDTEGSSNASPDISVNNENSIRAVSPAPSSSALSSIEEVTSVHTVAEPNAVSGSSTTPATSSDAPPAKRRKLTPSEKLEKQKAKEAKDIDKAEKKARQEEEKARKDEERVRKDDEKRVKDEERRKKAEEREAKKREKELEEERKAQEKLKKERSQMRLGAFFQKPAALINAADDNESQPRARRRSLSLELYDDVAESLKGAASPTKGTPPPASAKKPVISKPGISDYQRTFLPFELKPHTIMARSREYSEAAQAVFDNEIKDPSLREEYDLGIISSYNGHADMQHYFTTERGLKRGIEHQSARELADMIQGTSQQVVDLTGDDRGDSTVEQLWALPMKHIQFDQDVRPAYAGTYTKIICPRTIRKFRANPALRARPDTNYDYDSEAEWEEPEEGDEEIGSEDGDDADSAADANDIEDFLDDEDDDAKNKRKTITGELIPECTGLCWANEIGRIGVVESIEVQEQPPEMQGMRMGMLLPGFFGNTIDPFSTSYWQNDTAQLSAAQPAKDKSTTTTSMAPPRPPLQPRASGNGSPSQDIIGAAEGQKGPITFSSGQQGAKRGPKPAPKNLSKEDLDEFKDAVVNSPLGKLELQKALKQRFPKMTHEIIKETLSSQFAAVGKGKDNKRWVFVGTV